MSGKCSGNFRENSKKCPGKLTLVSWTNLRPCLATRVYHRRHVAGRHGAWMDLAQLHSHAYGSPFPKISWTFPGNFPEFSQKFPGKLSDISRKFPRHFLEIYWKFPGNFLDISRTFPGHFRKKSGRIPGNFREMSMTCP